jgi:hypothetical protein
MGRRRRRGLPVARGSSVADEPGDFADARHVPREIGLLFARLQDD